MKKIKTLIIKNKPFFAALSVIALVIIAVSISMILNPQATKSEFDVNGLNDQVQNHEKRIGDLEDKTDKTQTQTNQNSADIKQLQNNTNTPPASTVPDVHTPVATVSPPTNPAPPSDPNNNSWTNSHGTFIYKDINSTTTMFTGKNVNILFNWSSSSCSGFKANEINLIPAGTRVIKNNQLFPGQWGMDLTERYNQLCTPDLPSYYFTVSFSNDPDNPYFPGKWDIWW